MAAVTVRFFGIVGDIAKRKVQLVELADGDTVAGLLARLTTGNPAFGPVATQVRAVVNGENAAKDRVLRDGDDVLLMRAIGGGT